MATVEPMAASEVDGIYGALAKATGDIAESGVAKLGRNKEQGYEYRAMDDIYNVVAAALSKNGLVFVPNVLERSVEQRQSKYNTILYNVVVKVEYTIYHAGGGSIEFVVYGEAMDTGDKGTNKAMTAALKYALIQIFAIPLVGTNADADATTHEEIVAPGTQPRGSNQKSPPQKQTRGVQVPKGKPKQEDKPRKPLTLDEIADVYAILDKAKDDVDLAALSRDVYGWWKNREIPEKAAKELGMLITSKRAELATSDNVAMVLKMIDSFEKLHMIEADAAKVAVGSLKAKFNLE